MVAPNTLDEAALCRFLEEYGDDRVKRELLLFWGYHPNAKFARNAICYALDRTGREMDRGLKAFVEAGLMDTHILNGVTFYSLTVNEERRRPVLELATLDWSQWHLMLKHVEQAHKVVKVSMKKRETENAFQPTVQEQSQATSRSGSGLHQT